MTGCYRLPALVRNSYTDVCNHYCFILDSFKGNILLTIVIKNDNLLTQTN